MPNKETQRTTSPKVGIIIQARMGSTRLSGKVLLPLGEHEVLWHVVERCRNSKRSDTVIVATSTEKEDDMLSDWCKKHDIPVCRGSLENVLDRYHDCAKEHNLDVIIRITSDCPLIDPFIIDESILLLEHEMRRGVQYVSNVLNRIFPRGLDCEVFTFDALSNAHDNATTNEECEHVTVYMRKHLPVKPYTTPEAYRAPYRLTLDEEDDYRLLKKIYEAFGEHDTAIDVRDVIKFLDEHPEIAAINAHVEQKKVSA